MLPVIVYADRTVWVIVRGAHVRACYLAELHREWHARFDEQVRLPVCLTIGRLSPVASHVLSFLEPFELALVLECLRRLDALGVVPVYLVPGGLVSLLEREPCSTCSCISSDSDSDSSW